jgi:hypothetical protein
VDLLELMRAKAVGPSGASPPNRTPSVRFADVLQRLRAPETSETRSTGPPERPQPPTRVADAPSSPDRPSPPAGTTSDTTQTHAPQRVGREADAAPVRTATSAPPSDATAPTVREDANQTATPAATTEAGEQEDRAATPSGGTPEDVSETTGATASADASAEADPAAAPAPVPATEDQPSELPEELVSGPYLPDLFPTHADETEPTSSWTASALVGERSAEGVVLDDETTAIPQPEVSVAAEYAAVPQQAGEVAGTNFPSLPEDGERISTRGLLDALAARLKEVEQPEEPLPEWRASLLVDGGDPDEATWPGAQNAGIGRDATTRLLWDLLGRAGTPRAEGTTPLMVRVLAAQGDPRTMAQPLGTLHAVGAANPLTTLPRSETAALDVASGPYAAASPSEGGGPEAGIQALVTARRVLSRQAASAAFAYQGTVSEANARGRFLAREAGLEASARASREIEGAAESFVRAERLRARISAAEPRGSLAEWRPSDGAGQIGAAGVTPPAATGSTSAPQAPSPASPQAYLPLWEYLAQETRRQVRLGKQEFRIQLYPESLGNVELEVVWEGDILRVRFRAESRETERLLRENIGDLQRALGQHGMALDAAQPWDTPQRAARQEDAAEQRRPSANPSSPLDWRLRQALWTRSRPIGTTWSW